MKVTRIGVDLAKQLFQLHGVDERGAVVLRKTLSRGRMLEFFAQLAPCEVGMEACGGAHYWARELTKLGHQVRLLAPNKVKAYLNGNKNDRHDADAICEAMSRPRMRFVQPKTVAQQDMQTLHRVRAQLLGVRVALSNQIRGLLHEYGVVVSKGYAALRRAVPTLLAGDDQRVSPLLKEVLAETFTRLKLLEQRLCSYDRTIERLCKQDERAQRLLKVEGIGPLSATALVATVGNGQEFKNGRHLSAYLGLVPGHSASGGKTVMLPITKRGNRYLRTLLIHGGRSAVRAAQRRTDPRSSWINRLKELSGPNVAAVALANKNARIVWALLRYGQDYRPQRPPRPRPELSSAPTRTVRASKKTLARTVQSAAPRSPNRHFSARPQNQ
jgi:transposase